MACAHRQHKNKLNTKLTSTHVHFTPLPAPVPVPRVPLAVLPAPNPLPICDPALEPELVLLTTDVFAPDPPLKKPLPLVVVPLAAPRVPLAPRVPAVAAPLARRCCSRSSNARRVSSRRRSASAARRCSARCSASLSSSMASRSRVAPAQSLLRIRRWLCSVCERMRVQVLRRVEALVTVWETDYWVGKSQGGSAGS